MSYNHQEIEKKWQDRWFSSDIFYAKDDSDKEKFFCLIEFPYPSAAGLHAGHPRSYTALDVVARKQRHLGKNVLYPIGWDAFGLPTENYAIKTGRKPQEITKENTDTFRRQLQGLGISFDWSREINTTDPEYYKWTQWMFTEFFKAGLTYKSKMAINWCTSCKIGLANEEVVNGACERCGGEVEKRDKEQWMIAITKYAEQLLSGLDDVDYLEKIKTQQKNWIGRSEGAMVDFKISPLPKGGQRGVAVEQSIEVFTTRPDTLFGATYMVLAPEHKLVEQIATEENLKEVMAYVKEAKSKTDIERGNDEKEKTGVFTGAHAINPVNQEKIPIWVADYVLMGYGTGAIMAVPAHDERDFAFAKKFDLPIIEVVQSEEAKEGECYTGEGKAINSGEFNGLSTDKFKEKITAWLEKKDLGKAAVNYKLRDWVFSRQRYWGEPIPLVHCDKCDWIPVPEDQLPVELPDVDKYEPTDTGESPLAAIEDWVNTTCPECGGPARRETDTMPNWAGSSWYFLAYIMKGISSNYQLPITNYTEAFKYWMPVDLYNGGMEHVTLHLLYSRFWNKVLHDRGHVPVSEPYARRHSHGLVLAEDGSKMSKSKGNGVDPDDVVREYGADALRMYTLFMGPFEESVPFNMNGLIGVRRFLDKVMRYTKNWDEAKILPLPKGELEGVAGIIERRLKKASDDVDAFKFNTAVSSFMQLFNELGEKICTREQLKRILIVLCPYAPHVANECWEMIGEKGLVEEQVWPEFDEALLVKDLVEMAVQVNGKVRGTVQIAPDADEKTAKKAALGDENVQKHLEGKEVAKIIYVPGRILNIVIK